jgi:hypothetical protein
MNSPDVVFVDFLQWLNAKASSAYEKHSQIALWIQQTAIQNKVVMICTSQLSNETMKNNQYWFDEMVVSLKWAWEYYSSSDVIFVLIREDDKYKLKIEKNKLGIRGIVYEAKIDFRINDFTFSEIKNGSKI